MVSISTSASPKIRGSSAMSPLCCQNATARGIVEAIFWIALYIGAACIVGAIPFRWTVPDREIFLIPVIDLPAGVALAAILCLGYRAWPIIALAILLTHVLYPLSLAGIVTICLALTAQALTGRHLIDRASGKPTDSGQSLVFFLSAARGATVSAVLGATAQGAVWCLAGLSTWPNFVWLWLSLWLSGSLGMLFVTVLIAGRTQEPTSEFPSPRGKTIEAGLLGVCLAGAAATLLGIHPFSEDGFHLYLFIPLMVWAAFRFGIRGAAFAVLAILAPTAWGTSAGSSAFLDDGSGILRLQCLVVVLGGTTLALASAIEGFRRLEIDQFRAQKRLRQQVDRQSVELRSSNVSLMGQIAERLRMEQELRASQSRYQELFENANDIVYTHDLEGRFLSINKAGEKVSGFCRGELLGTGIDRLLAPEHLGRAREMIRQKLQSGVATVYELEMIRKDGGRVPLEVSTRIIYQDETPVAVQGIARDITERKRSEAERRCLEAKIQYAQRLESMTNLAEGLAHDFNNLLTRIVANVGVAALDLTEDSPAWSSLKRIETTAEHASELVDQMFAYAGKGRRRIETMQLTHVIETMSSLLESVVAKGIAIVYDLGSQTDFVAADTTQIRQVVMNLVINASDAISAEGGTIEVRTGTCRISAEEMGIWPAENGIAGGPLAAGNYAWLEVADDGQGIGPETLARVFDPFFTTKTTGRGLGLAAVLGIVRAHGGGIRISSTLSQGTTFQVLLPALDKANGDVATEWTGDFAVMPSLSEPYSSNIRIVQ